MQTITSCSLLIISRHSDGRICVDIGSVEEFGPEDPKNLQLLLDNGTFEERRSDDVIPGRYCDTTMKLILEKKGFGLANYDDSFVHAGYFAKSMGKTKKVLIGQKTYADIAKIQLIVKFLDLNLEIEYVVHSILAVTKKMRDWQPDVIITDKEYDDSDSTGEGGYAVAQSTKLNSKVTEHDKKVYLFSDELYSEQFMLTKGSTYFAGVISKKNDFSELVNFLKELSVAP